MPVERRVRFGHELTQQLHLYIHITYANNSIRNFENVHNLRNVTLFGSFLAFFELNLHFYSALSVKETQNFCSL